MVDNIPVNDATSTSRSVATDEIAGVNHQYLKVEYGADGSATPVELANPLPTRNAPGTLIDGSGAITTGGTAQNARPSNSSRRYLLVVNLDEAEELWLNLTATAAIATAGSIPIEPWASFVMEGAALGTGAVSVIAATTGHVFTVWEG